MLNRYVREVFGDHLQAKHINGRYITGPEVLNYFDVYVNMFQIGSKTFPPAMTMLEATAEANNRNASTLALALYKSGMDLTLTPPRESPTYIKEERLQVS